MDVGRTVREWRRRARLSQGELGRLAGIHQQNVARIELGRQVPRVDTLERLLRVCGAQLEADRWLGPRIDPARIDELLQRPPLHRLAPRSGFAPLRTLRWVAGHRVRCLVIGATAARLHGAPVPHRAVEILTEPNPMNRRRLEVARKRLRAIQTGITLRVRPPAPFTSYEELDAGASDLDVGGRFPLRLPSLDDLVRIGRHARSPGAREGAEILGALRERLAPTTSG